MFSWFILGFILPSGLCQDKGIVAKVNNKPITREYFNTVYEKFLQDFRSFNPGSPINKETTIWARRFVLDEIIKRELITREAVRVKFKVSDTEVEEKIKEVFFKGKDGKFDKTKYLWAINNPNIKWKEIRGSFQEELLYIKFQEYIMNREQASDKEVRDEYVKLNEKMKVQYVIIKYVTMPDTEITDKEREITMKKVDELRAKLKDSTEFETIVRESGYVPNETICTQFQYYIEGIGYVPELVKTSFDSPPGEIRTVNIPDGICLYKAREKIGIDEEAFAKEKEDLKKSLTRQKNSQAFEKWYEELKTRSKITVYLDS